MTKEQEAQQAQAIERWSHSGYEEMTPYDDGVYVMYDDHKAIVDSQAQKIAELSALFQKAGNGAVDLAMKCAEQEVKIAEQEKRIAELEKAAEVYVRKIESWGI